MAMGFGTEHEGDTIYLEFQTCSNEPEDNDWVRFYESPAENIYPDERIDLTAIGAIRVEIDDSIHADFGWYVPIKYDENGFASIPLKLKNNNIDNNREGLYLNWGNGRLGGTVWFPKLASERRGEDCGDSNAQDS